jgi:hypothetical protein
MPASRLPSLSGERSLSGRGRARGHEEAGFETSVLGKSDFFVKFAHQMAARKAYAQRSSRIAATAKSLMLRV